MDREKAQKFMDNLVKVNRMIEKNNRMAKGECDVILGSIIVHGIEKIADSLQLTRSYHATDDGYIVIRAIYNGFEFAEVLKPSFSKNQ